MSSLRSAVYKYSLPLLPGYLIQRYKRFLADVSFIENFEINAVPGLKSDELLNPSITVHCPNTGSMMGLLPLQNIDINTLAATDLNTNNNHICACSQADDKTKRKYKHTLEMIYDGSSWVGIHSALANKIVYNAIKLNLIAELINPTCIDTEVVYKDSRIDFELSWSTSSSDVPLLDNSSSTIVDSILTFNSNTETKPSDNNNSTILHTKAVKSTSTKKRKISSKQTSTTTTTTNITRKVLMEVKSVTLSNKPIGHNSDPSSSSSSTTPIKSYTALFPDCVSERAQKHCQHLIDTVEKGGEAVLFFLIQRNDCHTFSISPYDPVYGRLISHASKIGVRILAYAVELDPQVGVINWLGAVPFVDTYSDYDIL